MLFLSSINKLIQKITTGYSLLFHIFSIENFFPPKKLNIFCINYVNIVLKNK
jgi:hypothetical protein